MGIRTVTFVLLTSWLHAVRANDSPPQYQGHPTPDHYNDHRHRDDHHYNDHRDRDDHHYNDRHYNYRDRRNNNNYNQAYDVSSEDYYEDDYHDHLHPHHPEVPHHREYPPSGPNQPPHEHIQRGRAYPEPTSEGGTFADRSDIQLQPQVEQSNEMEQLANEQQQPHEKRAYPTLPKPTYVPPKLEPYKWVHSWISHFHAILCMVLYAGLIWKIRRERTSVGVSLQSMVALAFSEGISFAIRVADYRRTRFFDPSIIYTDLLSNVLAIWCAVMVRRKFNNAREDQLDTFGLNIINWFYVSIFTLPICPNFSQDSGGQDKEDKNKRSVPMSWVQSPDGMTNTLDVNMDTLKQNQMHLGQLRPTGMFGSISIRIYGLVLYAVIAVPLTVLFLVLKGVIRGYGHHSTIAIFVAAADAVRAVALIPQLYMFEMKQNKRISEQLLLYVTCEACLKILAILYWSTYSLFHYSSTVANLTRVYAICVQFINLLIILRLISAILNPSTRSTAIEKSAEMTIPMQESSQVCREVPGARNRAAISAASRGPYN